MTREKPARSASTASRTASATRCRCAQGLPSAVGEKLREDRRARRLRARPRAVRARFTGRGYVLPNRGQQGIPLVTVNTDKVEVEVYRIGDRNLVSALQSGDFQRRSPPTTSSSCKQRTGEKVYTGELDVAAAAQRGRHDRVPGRRCRRQVEARRLRAARQARPEGGRGLRNAGPRSGSSSPTSASPPSPAMTACTPSCARSPPPRLSSTSRCELIARNNEVLGTAKTDSRGYARFDAGLQARRGRPGARPCWWPNAPTATTPSSISTTGAFDLTDRGVKGREAPGPDRRLRSTPIAASTAPARRCISRRWCATAPARPRASPSPSSSRAPTASSTRASRSPTGPRRPRPLTLPLGGIAP